MGKGISVKIILELLFYVSADLIPLALPLAILLSSIMTYGNLAENNELTALKASGLSLYKIMKPLTAVMLVIAMATFYFSNYVIPVATLKWHSLIYDIQNTKISTLITPGVFSDKIDGYAIKVDQGSENQFKGILIHVNTDPNQLKTVRAKEGKIYKSANGKHIFFELHDGYVTDELSPQCPTFSSNGEILNNISNAHPSRRSSFTNATYKINVSGFQLSRSDQDLFKNQHEMLNVFQIREALDSIQIEADKVIYNFLAGLKSESSFFTANRFKVDTTNTNLTRITPIKTTFYLDSLSKQERIAALTNIPSNIRRINENLDGQFEFLKALDENMKLYYIGFHRKFALTYAIIVLFFIGSPLGAIIRKGGFGAPLVLAALMFMLYFVLMSVGEGLAMKNVVNPFIGMWFASLVLTPVAILLMKAAANDSQVFNKEAYVKLLARFKRNK